MILGELRRYLTSYAKLLIGRVSKKRHCESKKLKASAVCLRSLVLNAEASRPRAEGEETGSGIRSAGATG